MDTLPPQNRAVSGIRRLLAAIATRVRRVLGSVYQVVFHDQLGDLNRQTQRLGSASVESATYLATELRALNQRMSRIEEELAELRRAAGEDSGEVTAEPHSG
jgi:hypothetical protein